VSAVSVPEERPNGPNFCVVSLTSLIAIAVYTPAAESQRVSDERKVGARDVNARENGQLCEIVEQLLLFVHMLLS
jgi:hypothetical protein